MPPSLLNLQEFTPFPVMGPELKSHDFAPIDLSITGRGCKEGIVHSLEGMQKHITECAAQEGVTALFGGYLEHRCFYQQSPHFKNDTTNRFIHLGVDVWMPAGTNIFTPYPARIHSLAYNDQPLDYGATIILEHQIQSFHFHTLYGHLSQASIDAHAVGDTLEVGTPFASLGNPDENGGWTPHLHLQLIVDMEGRQGDYPGVIAPKDLHYYQKNCPNPTFLLGNWWRES